MGFFEWLSPKKKVGKDSDAKDGDVPSVSEEKKEVRPKRRKLAPPPPAVLPDREKEVSEADEREVRMRKLSILQDAQGVPPFRNRFEKKHSAGRVAKLDPEKFRSAEEVLKSPRATTRVAGRLLSIRDHGGILFLDVQDSEGCLQVACTKQALTEARVRFIREFLDPGDHIGVVGEPFLTRRGTVALHAASYMLLSKALLPLPTRHFGIANTETRYRKRYLDLVTDRDVYNRFVVRSAFVQAIRSWLLNKRFVELVTRTLQPVPGGANAETFKTHHRMLGCDYYLRISNELDLKMAIAGGFERVFEFAIDFRNEGIDASHVQEFQMLEWYCAFEDYRRGIEWTKEMLAFALKESLGKTTCTVPVKGGGTREIDFGGRIRTVTFETLLAEYGIPMRGKKEDIANKAKEVGIDEETIRTFSHGHLLDEVYKKVIRPHLVEPVFVIQHPASMLPLARRNDEDPSVADSYQLVVRGWEVVKGYSELVDPIEQRKAFTEQAEARKGGDAEAMPFNHEFLEAMEYGMPPMTGFGMGIERMVSVITGVENCKEVILFPLLGRKE